jgi:nitronate monooxygenase
VPVVSFTFGCPAAEVIAALGDAGSEVWVTVTDPAEARIAEAAGADALVLQGIEAGGHRASFVDRDGGAGLGLLALLRLVARESDLPLIAAGGIADGAGVAAVLAAGAAAAQLGTAFLRAPEAGTNPAHKAALATDTPTALTRAFTGRLARGLVNRFLLEHSGAAPSAYPHIHHATAPIRAAAREREDADGFNLWAGQAHALAKELPAGEIVASVAREARAALS